MKTISRAQHTKEPLAPGKQRSYNEIVEFLDARWEHHSAEVSTATIKKLDTLLGNPAAKLNAIHVGGTNGKSLTITFATQLFKEEGLTVGTFCAPHLLTYNERFTINNQTIANKEFIELANNVINIATNAQLDATAYELLTAMALTWFADKNADVILLEVADEYALPVLQICAPKIVALTRITPDTPELAPHMIKTALSLVGNTTHVISADQSKLNLQVMMDTCTAQGGTWCMPIRKLTALPYPFEQLHGRCAALAERIAHTFINNALHRNATIVTGTLLTKAKGQRGRPTREEKRRRDLNPPTTPEQFLKESHTAPAGRFQVLDKEKPTILLDKAHTLDAFKNLLLGIRLLHYQRPLKGLTLVLGINNHDLNVTELLKALRYFFKKTSGQIIVCPVETVPGQSGTTPLHVDKLTNDIKSMKIKARSTKTFKDAFEAAQKTVDERHGLVVLTGSPAIISAYWRYKGMKKLS